MGIACQGKTTSRYDSALLIRSWPSPNLRMRLKSLRKELEELKEGQKAIQRDLQEIRKVLRGQGFLLEQPKNFFLKIAGKPLRWNKNARLTLIEF